MEGKTLMDLIPNGMNKSVYYILPLLGLNMYSFGKDNFVNCYISHNGKVIVQLHELTTDTFDILKMCEHENYLVDFTMPYTPEIGKKSFSYIVFNVPVRYKDAFNKFVESKYSEMGAEAHSAIRINSNLPYKMAVPNSTKKTSSKILLALEKSKDLKAWLEGQMNVEISDDAELMSKLEDSEFLDIDTTYF